mmetsp:Transcript_30540/g.34828  ORF Transcript_30540/g.34828 Transcript_30540/m.34828 type:complete len:219 (-) Transcript_30540:60-716(-)
MAQVIVGILQYKRYDGAQVLHRCLCQQQGPCKFLSPYDDDFQYPSLKPQQNPRHLHDQTETLEHVVDPVVSLLLLLLRPCALVVCLLLYNVFSQYHVDRDVSHMVHRPPPHPRHLLLLRQRKNLSFASFENHRLRKVSVFLSVSFHGNFHRHRHCHHLLLHLRRRHRQDQCLAFLMELLHLPLLLHRRWNHRNQFGWDVKIFLQALLRFSLEGRGIQK